MHSFGWTIWNRWLVSEVKRRIMFLRILIEKFIVHSFGTRYVCYIRSENQVEKCIVFVCRSVDLKHSIFPRGLDELLLVGNRVPGVSSVYSQFILGISKSPATIIIHLDTVAVYAQVVWIFHPLWLLYYHMVRHINSLCNITSFAVWFGNTNTRL